ncbi:hypothetical protein CROQUDRAFT_707487 [Cronartium quercuum f. sp. fusiforme G11]|uniref:Uncharacterized protein n=1 Tax=Cronartium quercuum f. sp. fusiforme G11 TaxID=708437 RepID=A0A9P6T4Y2_9BASI|nr:hypothetical protein CROQUDRAFT_707487 [Cronartium quercuum f. sp. fusiforme G11]
MSFAVPKESNRWDFSKSQFLLSHWPYYSQYMNNLPEPIPGPDLALASNLKTNLKAFITLKVLQGMEKKPTIYDRISRLFVSLWKFQAFVAEKFVVENISFLQIKSFEALASILQHQNYAMSRDKIIARSSLSMWILSDAYQPPEIKAQIDKLNIHNVHFKLYQCIHGHLPPSNTKQSLLADITLAMVKAFCKPEDFEYVDTHQDLLFSTARQQKAVPVNGIPNAELTIYTPFTV